MTATSSGAANSVRFQANGTAGLSTAGNLEVRLYGWGAGNTFGHTHLTAADVDLRFSTLVGTSLDPAGRLDIAGDFYHLLGANLEIGFSGLDNSDLNKLQFDYLDIRGDVDLSGDLTLNRLGSYLIHEGEMFTFLHGNSVTGTFENVFVNGADGWLANLNYSSSSVAVQFTAIPEPNSCILVLISFGAILRRLRRQSR